jgi:hypothetical protein
MRIECHLGFKFAYQSTREEDPLPNRLSEGDLASVDTQLDNVRRWNEKFHWGFDNSEFVAVEQEARNRASVQLPRQAQVVTVYLDSVGSTFDAWWQVLSDSYEEAHRFPEVQSDPAHLRMWPQREFPSRRIDIVTLDLLAHRDPSTPTSVSDTHVAESAGLEVLAAVAHFHGWVTGFWQLMVDLSGCQLNIDERRDRPWGFVPTLTWKASDHPAQPVGLFLGAVDLTAHFAATARIQLVQ